MNNHSDFIAGIVLMLISITVFLSSFNIQTLTGSAIGPSFVPQVISLLMIVFSILLMVNSRKHMKKEEESGEADVVQEKESLFNKYKKVLTALFLMFVYVLLLNRIGFMIMTSLMLFCLFLLYAPPGKRVLWKFAVISIGTSIAIYVVFVYIFYLTLPTGILG